MDSHRPILSICLPTNGVVEWVLPTLESIYNQGVDYSLFEVVITDNGENSKLGEALEQYNYPNLRYYKTSDKGFLNLVTCLQKGMGLFNKMLNHRMMLNPGMLQSMINVVTQYKGTKPAMYFLNGNLGLQETTECDNLDSFVRTMNIFCSWSAGIGFWDIDRQSLSDIVTNEMFPNASLLFEHRQDTKYVIWNGVYGKMQDETGKGGYDLFKTFGVVLPGLIKDLYERKRVNLKTYHLFKIKNFRYLTDLYTTHVLSVSRNTFIIKNIKDSVSVFYGSMGYYALIVFAYFMKATRLIRGLN